MVMDHVFHSARSAAKEIGKPVCRILKAIHAGIVRPKFTSSKQLALTAADVETLRKYLSRSK